MATVLLGNLQPVETPAGTTVRVNDEPLPDRAPVAGPTIVLIDTPDFDESGQPIALDKKLTEVRNAFAVHSAGSAAWVEGHDEFFNQAVSQTFGCPVGRPTDWDAPVAPQEASVAPDTVTLSAQDVSVLGGIVG